MNVTLHRYSDNAGPGDLTINDLAQIWETMEAEGLIEVFFHDGHIRYFPAFVEYAAQPGQWFYAAKGNGELIGIGVANNFSSSGNTAYVHLCSFKAGRAAGDSLAGPFAEAGRQWFKLLHGRGGLDAVIAVLPACYHGARRWTEAFGFAERLRLPGALKLARRGGERITDAVVYQLNLKE